MTNFDENYVDEELNRQLQVARAKHYSAQCYQRRKRQNYARAIIIGFLLSFIYFVWQINRPMEPIVEEETAATFYRTVVSEPQSSEEYLGTFELTAYCSCETCCGQWALNRPVDENGEPIVYTASGAVAEMGVTVAVDPDVIPMGTQIRIEDLGTYTAQDTGNFSGNVIDIYFDDHNAARAFGRQDAEVWSIIN